MKTRTGIQPDNYPNLKSGGNIVVDTRTVNSPPSYYADKETCYEFKLRETLGLKDYMPSSYYVVLTTKKGWEGSYVVYQEAVSAGEQQSSVTDSVKCYRYGLGETWGEWQVVAKTSQVVRTDAAQSLTDEQKQQAQENLALQGNATLTTPAWYKIASASTGYIPKIIRVKLTANWGADRPFSAEAIIAIAGNSYSETTITTVGNFGHPAASSQSNVFSKIRLNGSNIEVYYNTSNSHTCKFEIQKYDHDNADITIYDFETTSQSEVSGSCFVCDFVNGINTTGGVYQNGSPVLVGDQSAIFENDGTTVKKATDVKTSINGKAISDIFMTDGTTVKKATNATNIIPDENGAVNPLGRKADAEVGGGSVALGSDSSASGNYSTALGANSKASGANSIALGAGPTTLAFSTTASGASSTALGAVSKASGNYSTAVGRDAYAAGEESTALGYRSVANGGSSTAVGSGATVPVTDLNTMQLGGSTLSTLRCKVNLSVTSDKRDKTDIEGITDALAFVERLNPVTFVSNERVNYISDEDKKGETFSTYGMCEYDRIAHAAGTKKGERRRCGLIAQDVVEAMQSVYGTDNYANIVNDNFHDLAEKPSDVENKYTLAYANLIPFLIGAIKELNAKIKELKGETSVQQNPS